ncbi:MAG: hypothetical protein K0Q81_709, partial [Paenibacillus sp.]|nr:hypothetical protein [Paenibacillus sp.]
MTREERAREGELHEDRSEAAVPIVPTDAVKLDVNWEAFLAEQDMEWVVRPISWDQGAFIGNGLLGAMMYGEENSKKRHVLRFVAGRTDVTASRADGSGSYSPRVPIGELGMEMVGLYYQPSHIRLDLWNAEITA